MHRTVFVACLAAAWIACAQSSRAAGAEPVKIILDLDLAEDVDDAGALATLHALADRGEAEILGVLISSRNEWRVVKKLIRPGSPTLAGSCGNGCDQISAGALGVHVRADPMRRHQRT